MKGLLVFIIDALHAAGLIYFSSVLLHRAIGGDLIDYIIPSMVIALFVGIIKEVCFREDK